MGVISAEALIALMVALVNLALDQADIHIIVISWISVIACAALGIDLLRRTSWVADPVYQKRRLRLGVMAVIVLCGLFGLFLTIHRKTVAPDSSMARSTPEATIIPPRMSASSADSKTPQKIAESETNHTPRGNESPKPEGSANAPKVATTPAVSVAPSAGTVNNCPNGICISGGNVTNPTVNNYVPPPLTLTWSAAQKPSPDKTLTFRTDVTVTPNVDFHPVSLIIVCDQEIKDVNPGGAMFIRLDSGVTAQSNKIGYVYYQDPSLAANRPLVISVFSDRDFKVLDVRPANIKPRRNAFDPQ